LQPEILAGILTTSWHVFPLQADLKRKEKLAVYSSIVVIVTDYSTGYVDTGVRMSIFSVQLQLLERESQVNWHTK
jgi:hypothetical protein